MNEWINEWMNELMKFTYSNFNSFIFCFIIIVIIMVFKYRSIVIYALKEYLIQICAQIYIHLD